jgi:hypothetical protein
MFAWMPCHSPTHPSSHPYGVHAFHPCIPGPVTPSTHFVLALLLVEWLPLADLCTCRALVSPSPSPDLGVTSDQGLGTHVRDVMIGDCLFGRSVAKGEQLVDEHGVRALPPSFALGCVHKLRTAC